MVNWDDEDIKEFKKSARAAQQEYCDLLGDREWDAITKLDWTVLRRKVGFGVYGPPSSVPTEDNRQTGYNKEQLNVVEQICCQMVENLNFANHSIYFACLFVIVKVHERTYTVPVFKAKSSLDCSQQCIFVDTGARKYGSWVDYLSDNTLEKCIFCYPTLGVYENNGDNEVCIKFGTSPACNLISRTFNLFDTVATVATVAATGVGLAALCTIPVAGPIMAASAIAGASTGAYGVTRSAYALYDRASHSQSIGLSDSDARGCWLSIVGSSLGFAQGRMIASMTNAARAGDVMGKAGRIAFLLVQTGSLTVNGIGIVHGLAVLIDKHEREQLTALDIFQFSTSVLFFTNAALNAKTASTIIKEVQHEVIDSHRAVLNKRAKKVFNKKTGMLRGPDEMHGNAKVVKHLVKDLKTIETTKDLYEMMANKNVNERKVKLTPDGFKGMLNVNKNLKVHPMKLLEIPSETRQTIFQSTKHLQNGTLSRNQFHADMKKVCRTYRITFETMREDTVNKLCQMFGKERLNDIEVGHKKIFSNIRPHQIDRMRVVMENTMKNSDLILKNATKFAAARDCSDPKAFISHAEFFVAVLNEEVRSYEASYHNDLAVAKNNLDFNQAQFDKSCGIPAGMKRVKFHEQKALDFFSSEDGFAKLNKQYDTLKATVGSLNAKSQLGFFGNDAATYHYMKHKSVDDVETTPEQYFKIAEEVVGKPTNKTNSILSQDGSCVMITYLDTKRGVRAIKYDRGEGSGIATVMYDPKVQNGQ